MYIVSVTFQFRDFCKFLRVLVSVSEKGFRYRFQCSKILSGKKSWFLKIGLGGESKGFGFGIFGLEKNQNQIFIAGGFTRGNTRAPH